MGRHGGGGRDEMQIEMRISSSTYMGVATLMRLAVQTADTPCTTQGLAGWINRSVSYTETLMARLRTAGPVAKETMTKFSFYPYRSMIIK